MLPCRRLKLSHVINGCCRRNYTVQSDMSNLVTAMKNAKVSRACITTDDNGGPRVSHPVLDPIAEFLRKDTIDYDKHEAMFFGISPATGELMSAFLWKTKRGQGCGGIRYDNFYRTCYLFPTMRISMHLHNCFCNNID